MLTSGTKLGPYEIQSQLGAGGMGEVYRARDARLDRTVALKILPSAFSADPDRLHRFQHEAKVLSALNHPNVLAIYDVGEENGVRFLVSEFLEGQSLRDTLAVGTLSRRRLIEYALDVAKGLAAAHEKGIVHRDLKPDNIFITRDDRVKVLDFGLAKQVPDAASDSATMTGAVPTIPGTVMGTVGYMSPEQVRGLPLDHRSDIFSFGAVLYEMASGTRAFRGDSSVETMNAILKEEVPELSESGVHVSPGLERIIRRCLEKKPERRFQSASDLAFALDALSAGSGISQPVGSTPLATKKTRLAWIVAALAALVLIACGFWFFRQAGPSLGKFSQISFRPAYIRAARFAPGRTIVYAASVNGGPMTLFSTRTDTFEAQPLNLTADLLSVSHSSELAVSLGRDFDLVWTPVGRLAKAPLGGGATRELLDDVIDADWNKDGTDLAVARRVGNQFRLEYPAGKVLYQTAGYISDVRFSPAGDQIAFLDHGLIGDDRGVVSVIDLEGHRRRVLTQEFESVQGLSWSTDGKEIWFSASEAAELNSLRSVDLSGKLRMVAAAPARLHLQDISEEGQILLTTDIVHYQVGTGESKAGTARDLTAFEYTTLSSISNDGSMILMNSFDIAGDTGYRLYVQHTDGSAPVLVGHGAGSAFSPDNKWVAAIDPGHPENLAVIPTGIGDTRNLHSPAGTHYVGVSLFSDDKHALITTSASGQTPQSAIQDIETGSVRSVGPKDRYVAAFVTSLFPGPSPDGKLCIQTDGSRYWLQSLEDNTVREVSGIARGERIINWHADSNNVFLAHPDGINVQVYNLNLTTGERKLWTMFSPPDKTARAGHTLLFITPDGAHFAYESHRIYSTLFIAKGLR